MGGEASGCTEATTDVLIESALWEPLNIAQTGRKLGINSDARHRFERGVDPAFMVPGLELATRDGPRPLRRQAEPRSRSPARCPTAAAVIDFPVTEVKRLAGIDPAVAEVVGDPRASRLRLQDRSRPRADHGDRADLAAGRRRCKADLVEEIVRIIGVDNVPPAPLPRAPGAAKPVLTLIQTRTRRAKRALAARGLVEAVTWSFISRKDAEAFGGGDPALALANPIAADMSDMRPSLLPGLIAAAQRNADRGFADLALFEVGQVYRGDGPDGSADRRRRRPPRHGATGRAPAGIGR